MLDLLLIRGKGGNPELVYESQKRRFKSTDIIDKCIELDKTWKESK
jgi:seryl-tRNA synthetase